MPLPFPALPLDPDNAAHRAWLASVQGNIVKGHGRKYTRLVFFKFRKTDRKNRLLLPAAVREKLVTSAAYQMAHTQAYKLARAAEAAGLEAAAPAPAPGFYGLGLTQEFFWQCELDRTDMPPESGAFRNGAYMTNRGSRHDPGNWQPVYRSQPHGAWLLAHEHEIELGSMQDAVEHLLARHNANIVGAAENGFKWGDPADPKLMREPFGFRDGISQALFFKGEYPAPNFVQYELGNLLIEEDGAHRGGSFMVVQKFEQNVQAFRKFETAISAAFAGAGRPLPVTSPGALLVGRERDGQPLVGAPGDATLNNFDFAAEPPSEARCPFHAHIRKANARSESPQLKENAALILAKQFMRRGVIFDARKQLPPVATPDYPAGDEIRGDVGLLFMGYMRDPQAQFLHMLKAWFERKDFPFQGMNMPDPMMAGDVADTGEWNWSGAPCPVGGLGRFVTTRGAAYLYVPALDWLNGMRA